MDEPSLDLHAGRAVPSVQLHWARPSQCSESLADSNYSITLHVINIGEHKSTSNLIPF